jgi:uncharacterized membrane protein YoaK (UPF0700 family)
MPWDAVLTLLAIALLVAATVVLSKAHRRTKRVVLSAEVALIALAIVYFVLLRFAWR